MSDLSFYELEDIIWDDFGQSDDHIVPHSSNEKANGHASEVDSCKKPRVEVTGLSSNGYDKYSDKCDSLEEEKRDLLTVNIPNTMLERGPWTILPDNILSSSYDCDPIKEISTIVSDNSKSPRRCFKSNNMNSLGELCSEDAFLSGSGTIVDSNSYSYPLHISQAQNDLSFIDKVHEDESSDLLYYNWSDIGNFEDVDGMLSFRSCDPSFGLAGTGKRDEMGWFSVSDDIEGSEDASKSKFMSSGPDSNALGNLSEDFGSSKATNECCSANGVICKPSSQLSEIDESASLSGLCFVNGSRQLSEMKNDFILGDQPHFQKNQQKQREGKRKDQHVENGLSCHSSDTQKKGTPTLSGIKAENSDQTSFPEKESTKASNRMQPLECYHKFSFGATDIAPEGMRGKLPHHQRFQQSVHSNSKHVDMDEMYPVSVRTETEFEMLNDIKRVGIEIPPELCPSSSLNSGLNEASPEASSFRQLQEVVEQLDLRTKLCIRDSLYRLARSAEQRHNYPNLNGGLERDGDAKKLVADGKKCSGYADIETDTNPIDRSIAHLLFHRPSLSINTHSSIPGPVNGPPMAVERLLNHKESATAEADRKVADP